MDSLPPWLGNAYPFPIMWTDKHYLPSYVDGTLTFQGILTIDLRPYSSCHCREFRVGEGVTYSTISQGSPLPSPSFQVWGKALLLPLDPGPGRKEGSPSLDFFIDRRTEKLKTLPSLQQQELHLRLNLTFAHIISDIVQ